jgi:hypothetical protein
VSGILFDLEETSCVRCGIRFAVPPNWLEGRRNDKEGFYCPNGHVLSYKKSLSEKLSEELSATKQRLAYQEDETRRQRELRDAAERQAAAARGQVTKLKKRASAGVCPCCNRSFLALGRHMQTKHPGFIAEPIEGMTNVLKLPAKVKR